MYGCTNDIPLSRWSKAFPHFLIVFFLSSAYGIEMCSTKWEGGEDGKKASIQKRDLERLSGYAGGF